MKPSKPYTRKEIYLDRATGGEGAIPEPIPNREYYYAKIAGASVSLPTPVIIYDKFLAKIAGMDVEVPTYNANMPHIYLFLAKAAGQDVEIPVPVTREEMYWYDYINAAPQPTEKEYTGAVPVTITADGTPLIDYLISGNMSQTGTPTPETPVMPQGCGNKTANLLDLNGSKKGYYIDASGVERQSQYTVYEFSYTKLTPVEPSTTYTLSVDIPPHIYTSTNRRIHAYDASGNWIEQIDNLVVTDTDIGVMSLSFTTPSTCKYVTINYLNNTYSNGDIWLMLNTGSTALPYEPFGVKIPILSADTTTNNYLGEVETTRKIKKLVLTGTETIDTLTVTDQLLFRFNTFYTNDKLIGNAVDTLLCNVYKIVNGRAAAALAENNYSMTTYNSNTDNRLIVHDDRFTTVEDFKAYLAQQYAAGTPVTVWYVLSSATTGIVNEPLMRIGDYADTLSEAQAGVEIPTNNGSTTVDVDTTVKPSEVYIKYMGV